MSTKHTAIANQVRIDWTSKNRGTLYDNKIMIGKKNNVPVVAPALGKGTADLVGIENIFTEDFWESKTYFGLWVSIEIKCRGDWLKKEQKNHCQTVLNNNGVYYLALEMPGCTIKNPEYKLFQVHNFFELPEIRREWNQIFKEST